MNFSPLIPRLRHEFAEAQRYWANWPQWDESRAAEVQLRKLQVAWADAVADVPYYEHLVTTGAAPKEIRSWDDFHALPELNRQIYQADPAAFVRRSRPYDRRGATAGTTGNPIQFGVWQSEDVTNRILKLVLWQRAGYTLDSTFLLLWGHTHLLGKGWRRLWKHLQRTTKDALVGYLRVDAYRFDLSDSKRTAERMLRFKPTALVGYSSTLDYFARSNPEYHDRFRKLGLKFAQPAGEAPPRPDSLELLRDVFACKTIQEFGGGDFGQVAMRMDGEPYFTFPDFNILEAVPGPGDDATSGATLITALYPRCFPIFRYRQNDAISGAKRYAHGHVYEFEQVVGRTNDMVQLNSGAIVHSGAIFACVFPESAIHRVQMVIDDAGLTLRVVLGPGFGAVEEARVKHKLAQVAPELGTMKFERVEDVEPNLAGKRRWFVDNRTRQP